MNEILAAAFGVATNQIAKSLNELGEAYDKLKGAGVPLTVEDKRKFDFYMKRLNELWLFLHDIEFNEMISRISNKNK